MDSLNIKGTIFNSRLILGTGKFASVSQMSEAVKESGTEMVTVALRRVDLHNPSDNLLHALKDRGVVILPNTSGAQNADEAVRLARLARASGVGNWVKLEVIPDPKYLLPDSFETLKAAEILVKEGFLVMPYVQADPLLCKRLEEIGTVSVMPLAAPIGSNQGLKTLDMLKIIIEQSGVPVIIDAGLGKPSHACMAMELGASAVLINTAIATAANPAGVAAAFRLAVEAGRKGYLSGMPLAAETGHPSSTLDWISSLA